MTWRAKFLNSFAAALVLTNAFAASNSPSCPKPSLARFGACSCALLNWGHTKHAVPASIGKKISPTCEKRHPVRRVGGGHSSTGPLLPVRRVSAQQLQRVRNQLHDRFQ